MWLDIDYVLSMLLSQDVHQGVDYSGIFLVLVRVNFP